ncbi:protein KIAA0100-like, partial [Ctenocephalides felis]|uniref:protein KIAA0100-like n=1 Tax=Ctenocephalides felis TaxID=7515 RepID=UPI000E6E459D
MMIYEIIILVSILILIFAGFRWALPLCFAFHFKRKYHTTVRIGRLCLPCSLRDVVIYKNGFSVNIEEVSVRSSLFNSDVTKLVSIEIRDVRIKKDIGEARRPHSSGPKSSLIKRISRSNSWHNETSNSRNHDEFPSLSQNKVLDFREIEVPRIINTFAQFMAVQVYNISVVLLRSKTPGWLLHATARDIHLDGSIVNSAKSLLVNVTLGEAEAKMLHHTPKGLLDSEPCLVELSFAISLEAMLIAQGPISVEKLNITMKHTKFTVHEGLYSFLTESKNKFDLQIDDTTLTGMRDNSRKEFSALLQCLKLNTWFTPSLIPDFTPPSVSLAQMYCGIEEFEIHSLQERLVLLRKFSIDAKLEDNNMVNLSVKLHTLHLFYNHRYIHTWISTNFLHNKASDLINVALSKEYYNNLRRANSYNKTSEHANENEPRFCKMASNVVVDEKKNRWLETIFSKFIINGSIVELWNVCAMIKMYDQSMSLGFSHSKLILDQLPETRDIKLSNKILHMLLGKRHWSTELLLESLWLKVSTNSNDLLQMKKYHIWGTSVYLGMALVKLCSHGKSGCKMEAMLDTIRTEWSPQLSLTLIQASRCVQEYSKKSTSTTMKELKAPKSSLSLTQNMMLNISFTNLNTFFITENNLCSMMRLESMMVDNCFNKCTLNIHGLKFCTVMEIRKHFLCPRADEIDDFFGYIKTARIDLKRTSKLSELTIQLLEEVHMNWSANLHLHFIELHKDIKQFQTGIKTRRSQIDEGEILENTENEQKQPSKPKTKWSINVNLKGDISLEIFISEQHLMNICADEINITTSEDLSISVSCIVIYIDGADIFTIQGFQMARLATNEKVVQERNVNEDFVLAKNKIWGVTIQCLRAVFPYEHQYADAIHNEFISLFKWLKIIHGRQKKPFTIDSPLPSDLVITVKEFLFEMSDDPFEVKLRDNYELLEDEYKESLKRQKMLDAKVAELCKTHPLLAAGKVEELYTNLCKKNAEIYVQRSRLCSSGPTRTRLFAWCLNELEIIALADPSIHGTENCTKVMRSIDPDSPWPEEGIVFTTLWCRSVVVSCVEWKFLLRDYPQPMLDIRNLTLFGLLVGAEQEAPRRAKRDVVIDLGEPWGQQTIERGMTTLKFYHDFNCEVDRWSYAFGPCWEPVMAQCNLSFEKISSPSRDPSPTLPFWDKMRLLFHGRLTMWVKQLTVLLHASLDPYNTTEEMELSWSDVAMDWTNAKIVFKGNFNVYVRTASKYDDCQLLKIPHLKLTIKLQWICLANPNDHHSVIPCAPDKVPEYSINQEHDSFRAFRSQNVNINISFETKDVMPKTEGDYPILVLFGSTLRWFESLKLILSGVTRPTRRGTVFKNVRPRRAQLSRHYKTAHLIFSLHKFQVCYWMSFAKQRGFQLDGQKISSSSEHNLSLHPINDGLRHRPRAEWSIMYMTSQLDKTDIWLKSALQEDINDIRESMDNLPVEKCFCLSVDSVSYGRAPVRGWHEGNQANRDINTPTHQLVVRDLKGAWTKSNRDVAFALFDTFMKNKQLKKNLSTEALKGFRNDNNSTTPLKSRRPNDVASTPVTQSASTATPSPLSKVQSGHAAAMLQQLIAEAENKALVFSDDLSAQISKDQQLQGLQACQNDDVVHNNWLIALVNSQVLLKGCETQGYIILSAAKAEILQRVHQPVWRDRSLVPKTTWVGSLECMQYYATVSAGESDSLYEKIMWLEKENIE